MLSCSLGLNNLKLFIQKEIYANTSQTLLLSTVNSFLLGIAGLHKVEKWKLFDSLVASLPGLFPTLYECHPF